MGLDARRDVADSTVDIVAAMVDNDAIVYLPWEKCPTRSQERRGAKVDERWLVDHDIAVKYSNVTTLPTAQLGADLQLQDAVEALADATSPLLIECVVPRVEEEPSAV